MDFLWNLSWGVLTLLFMAGVFVYTLVIYGLLILSDVLKPNMAMSTVRMTTQRILQRSVQIFCIVFAFAGGILLLNVLIIETQKRWVDMWK